MLESEKSNELSVGMLSSLLSDSEQGSAATNQDDGNSKIEKRSLPRLVSLDVLRGLTIALMIFVDNVGDTNPGVDHAPWDGMSLADFVMPCFDFMVGVALIMSMQSGRFKKQSKPTQIYHAVERSIKLFVIGILTQAGTEFPTYDLQHLRIMGILQRVSLCYLVASITEILLQPTVQVTASGNDLSKQWSMIVQRKAHWMVMIALIALHTILLYHVDAGNGCGTGNLTPECNSASTIDAALLGINHMYFPTNGGAWSDKDITFMRTSDCSSCSPGKCAPPVDAPAWCGYGSLKGGQAFDPEGLVSSLTAVCASLFGANVSAAILFFNSRQDYLFHWLLIGSCSFMLGIVVHFAGMPMNTDLYSWSFTSLTNGVSCLVLCCISFSLDGESSSVLESVDQPEGNFSRVNIFFLRECSLIMAPFDDSVYKYVALIGLPFKWLGMNSILIYLLSCTDITSYVLGLVYWGSPSQCLSNAFWPTGLWWGPEDTMKGIVPMRTVEYPTGSSTMLLWCLLLYIPVWMVVAGYLHSIKWYLKV